MQTILGFLRKACQEFDLIDDGDKIAIGVSGGKDSLVMLAGLARMRRFYEKKYDIVAITIDPHFGGEKGDYSSVSKLCEDLGVEYRIIDTDIAPVVFDIRKEKHPCSLCAKMRRGALHDAAIEAGCNKLALAHSNDDVIETFVMNLFHEARVGCFAPKAYLSRKKITVIRPLAFAPEKSIISACKKNGFEIIKSKCPADKNSERTTTRQWLIQMEKERPGFRQRMFHALRSSGVDGWGFKKEKCD